jgi:hypothetical protein
VVFTPARPQFRTLQFVDAPGFDDGNTRVAVEGGGNSRGQALQVDEQNRVVTPVLNADLDYYAEALGSAHLLLDGNYHFDVGFVQENNTIDPYSLEVAPSGRIVYRRIETRPCTGRSE